jgi:hypothetical protein
MPRGFGEGLFGAGTFGDPDIEVGEGSTTEEIWIVNGQLLNTWAFNIGTLSGRETLPPRRGENYVIPGRPGTQWQQKEMDERMLVLAMWVRGAAEDGTVAPGQRATFMTNWEKLKRVFGVYDAEVPIVRRFRDESGVHERYAWAEVDGEVSLEAAGPSAGQFAVSLRMADPYWYSEERLSATRAVSPQGGIEMPLELPMVFPESEVTGVLLLTNDGPLPTYPVVRFHGPALNPRIEHSSGKYMQYQGELGAGEEAEIDTWSRTVKVGESYRYGALSPGSRWWMIDTGTNEVRFEVEAGLDTALAEIRWRAGFL